jgi:hypothetical protein
LLAEGGHDLVVIAFELYNDTEPAKWEWWRVQLDVPPSLAGHEHAPALR